MCFSGLPPTETLPSGFHPSTTWSKSVSRLHKPITSEPFVKEVGVIFKQSKFFCLCLLDSHLISSKLSEQAWVSLTCFLIFFFFFFLIYLKGKEEEKEGERDTEREERDLPSVVWVPSCLQQLDLNPSGAWSWESIPDKQLGSGTWALEASSLLPAPALADARQDWERSWVSNPGAPIGDAGVPSGILTSVLFFFS